VRSVQTLLHDLEMLILFKEVDERTYIDRVTKLINDLIDGKQYEQREDIRAIVLFGEASDPAFDALGTIAHNAIDIESVQIMTDLAPWEAVPHGAAMWGRLVQVPPCAPHDWVEFPGEETYGGPVNTPMYNRLLGAPGERFGEA
jgi:hypothetical protein